MYLPLHSCIHHNSLHVDRSSTENTDLDQFVKMSFVSNEGMIKWKMLALNLEIYMSQISDTFSFEIGTNNVPIGEGIYGLVDFTQYGEIDKKLG